MLFHSYGFLLVFLPLTWAIFLVLKRHHLGRWALTWLTVMSFVFYGWWYPRFLLLLLGSIGVNYAVAIGYLRTGPAARRLLLWAGVLFNLGLIGYFKYAGFLLEIASSIAGVESPSWHTVLPLAISFFTFQQIAYLVDAYRDPAKVERRAADYALFVVFFPQLIAGPIIHPSELLPELERTVNLPLRRTLIAVGLSMFAIGMFKKVMLADHVGPYFAAAYAPIVHGATLSFLEAWAVMTASAMQIYFDYSGYADMAAGLGLLFGVRLPLNFFSPYKGTSPVEFWRRWNITLMRFLRDYVYIPLGGSRHGDLRKYGASLATMLVCGIWHGSGWNYVIWGGAVGAIIILNNLWDRAVRPTPAATPAGRVLRRVGGRAVTFACYVVPLAVFMFPSAADGLRVAGSMAGLNGFALPAVLGGPAPASGFAAIPDWRMLGWIGVCLAVTYGLPNCQQLFGRFRPTLQMLPAATLRSERPLFRWRPTRTWALIIALLAVASLTQMHQVREFFYFQF